MMIIFPNHTTADGMEDLTDYEIALNVFQLSYILSANNSEEIFISLHVYTFI